MDIIINNKPLTNKKNSNMHDFIDFKGKPLFTYNYKLNSQNGEDGILYFIFRCIGVTNRRCIEICAGNGKECNTANLILKHNFKGLLFDGNLKNVSKGKNYFRLKERESSFGSVNFIHAWITKKNITNLIKNNNFNGEIDLLSLDIDGVDYWILKQLLDDKTINPRVIILEYQDIIGPELAITVPYSDDFNGWTDSWHGPNYCGASLKAFMKLLKNYYFIGSNEKGYNAFFIRNDIKTDWLKEEKELVKNVFHFEKCVFGMKYRWPRVKNYKWIDV